MQLMEILSLFQITIVSEKILQNLMEVLLLLLFFYNLKGSIYLSN